MKERTKFTQISLFSVLLSGRYGGVASVAELKKLGNMSIATMDRLDGEMQMIDGVVYQACSDGKVYLVGTDVIPTWVNMHSNNGKKEYNILPLTKDTEDQWQSDYELTDHQFSSCQKSYNRTMGIVGEGLEACQSYLAQAKIDREEYYYDLAHNPEKYATEPAPVETVVEETTIPETTLAAA